MSLFSKVAFCIWFFLGLAAGASANEVLAVNHWADFLAKSTRSAFTAQTGILIQYSESSSMKELDEKMSAGNSGYDTITPSHVVAADLIKKGLLQKPEKTLIPNLKNLSPEMMQRLQLIDPGNQYLVPFSFTGIILGYNETRIREVLGEELPRNKLELLFNPAFSKRLKSCGINVIDYPADAFSMALAYLGRNPLSVRPSDMQKAHEALSVIRPYITQFKSDAYYDDLAEGRVCLTTGFTSDIMLAISAAEKSKSPYEIKAAIIPDQSPAYFTVLAIPADSKNPKAAARWINHLLDPGESAALTQEVGIATGNVAAEALLPPAISSNPLLVLSKETYRKFYLPMPIPQDVLQMQEKLWAELKAM